MLTFRVRNEDVLHNGERIGSAYSGHGEGRSNPTWEAVSGNTPGAAGPIPCGKYRLGPAFTHPTKGPLCIPLTPLPGTDVHGRTSFLWHGCSALHPNDSSLGCLVSPHDVRAMAADSHEKVIEVVPGELAAVAPHVGMGDVHDAEGT